MYKISKNILKVSYKLLVVLIEHLIEGDLVWLKELSLYLEEIVITKFNIRIVF